MRRLGRDRSETLDELGRSYARNFLSTSTFEARVAAVLRAPSSELVRRALWDLPRSRPRTTSPWLGRLDVWRFGAPVGISIGGPEPVSVFPDGDDHSSWTVGRSRSCDVRVPDSSVSRFHARIIRRGSAWTVVDLDSTNGVRLNGRHVRETQLMSNDVAWLGAVPVKLVNAHD